MIKRKIELKRRIILVQLLTIFPIIIFGGIFAIFIPRCFDYITKIILTALFIIICVISYLLKEHNKYILEFSPENILISKNKKNRILNSIDIKKISSLQFDDRNKKITATLVDNTKASILSFPYNKHLSTELYFKTKAELCRYYPQLSHSQIDEYTNMYIETNIVPKHITDLQKISENQAIITLIFEFIIATIPLGLMLLSVVWSILELIIITLKTFVNLLNITI